MRVVIAEDSVLLREGLIRLLDERGIEVVAAADTAEVAMLHVDSEKPDVAILDIRLPPTHTDEGMKAALRIRAEHPQTAVLVLSQYVEVPLAMQLLGDSAEGVGYLLKDRILNPTELTDAIHRVGGGGSAIDPTVIEHLLKRRSGHVPLTALTSRERDVLAAMAEGRSNLSIATKLHISDKTVEACTGRIFTKLGLEPGPDDHRRVRAVLTYLQATPHAG